MQRERESQMMAWKNKPNIEQWQVVGEGEPGQEEQVGSQKHRGDMNTIELEQWCYLIVSMAWCLYHRNTSISRHPFQDNLLSLEESFKLWKYFR